MTQNNEQGSAEAGEAGEAATSSREEHRDAAGSSLVKELRQGGREFLAFGKQRLVGKIGGCEAAVLEVSSKLRTEGQEMLARRLGNAAACMGGVRRHVDGRTAGELLEEAGGLCRRHPAACFAGAFLAGLAAARFLKASAPDGGDVAGGAGDAGQEGEETVS